MRQGIWEKLDLCLFEMQLELSRLLQQKKKLFSKTWLLLGRVWFLLGERQLRASKRLVEWKLFQRKSSFLPSLNSQYLSMSLNFPRLNCLRDWIAGSLIFTGGEHRQFLRFRMKLLIHSENIFTRKVLWKCSRLALYLLHLKAARSCFRCSISRRKHFWLRALNCTSR